MPPILEVKDLHVRFRTERRVISVLNGINLNIHAAERIGLVGESGSGKSVLAWSLLGLLPDPGRVEKGSIYYKNRNVDICQATEETLQSLRGSEIALIASNPRAHLNPVATVGTQLINVFRAHLQLQRAEATAKALEVLEAVGIPDPTAPYGCLSASIEWRNGPACRDCPGLGLRPKAPHRRRTDQWLGCYHPGSDFRSDEGMPNLVEN